MPCQQFHITPAALFRAALFAATPLFLYGCGKAPVAEQQRSAANSSAPQTATGPAPTDTRLAPTSGRKTLVYSIGNDISAMDPAQINDIESGLVAAQVYQGLLKFKSGTVDVEPDLAEKYDVSDDGRTWTFHLRKNIKFHDGTPLNAEAVVFSVQRQMDESHPYHVPGKMQYASTLFGDPGSTESKLVEQVTAPNESTVVFKLARRYMPFARNLAMAPAAVVPPGAVRTLARDFATTMVGTGPFRIKSYLADNQVTLVRNEQYWGSRPPLDEIRFRILRDTNVRMSSIRKGESDVISGIEPTSLDNLRADARLTVFEEPSMNLGFISMNCKQPPFDNKLVRQAVYYAIDREYIANKLFTGTSVAAKGILPPGMLGNRSDRAPLPFDPARAKELLNQAGFPNGISVTFTTHDKPRIYFPVGAKLGEKIQQDLAKAGITAKLDVMEFPTFLAKTKSRDYALANSGWVTDNGDPDNFIYYLAGRADNEFQYSNPEAARIMLDAAGEQDESKRAQMYQKVEDMLQEDPPLVPINHAKQILVARKTVKNFTLHPTGVTQLAAVDLE